MHSSLLCPRQRSKHGSRLNLEAEVGDLVAALPPILAGGKRGRDPKAKPRAEAARGRPSKQEKPSRSQTTPATMVEKPYDGNAEFLAAEKKWADSLLEGRTLAIRHPWLLCSDGFKLLLWCNSCRKFAKSQGGWRATSAYTISSQTITRRYTPQTARGQFDLTRAWNPLTATTESGLECICRPTPRSAGA